MENLAIEQLSKGLAAIGLEADGALAVQLAKFATLLLKWNDTTNLTAITNPLEVVEKHLLDSLLVCPEVAAVRHLLDFGAGGGLPGIPLALANPKLAVTLVDSVNKKVTFLKVAAAQLGLSERVSAQHARLQGDPTREGLELADAVISRAFMDVERFVGLSKAYVVPGGKLVAMVGQCPPIELIQRVAEANACELVSVRSMALPFSGHPRSVIVMATRST